MKYHSSDRFFFAVVRQFQRLFYKLFESPLSIEIQLFNVAGLVMNNIQTNAISLHLCRQSVMLLVVKDIDRLFAVHPMKTYHKTDAAPNSVYASDGLSSDNLDRLIFCAYRP